MLSRRLNSALALLVPLSVVATADAATTMRCGQNLAEEGDSTYVVKKKCGTPADQRQYREYRNERVREGNYWRSRSVEVVVDEWIYDFGRQEFLYHLRFEQGKLTLVREDRERGTD